jgi:hypothetical protein
MISGRTRDAGREGDRKKGRDESEGVCWREKHDDWRGRMGGKADRQTKKKVGHEKDRRTK